MRHEAMGLPGHDLAEAGDHVTLETAPLGMRPGHDGRPPPRSSHHRRMDLLIPHDVGVGSAGAPAACWRAACEAAEFYPQVICAAALAPSICRSGA